MENRAKRLIKILTRNIMAMALAILALVALAKAAISFGINDDYITVGLVVLLIVYFTTRDYTADKWRHVHIDLTIDEIIQCAEEDKLAWRDVLKTDDGVIYEVSVAARRIHLLDCGDRRND